MFTYLDCPTDKSLKHIGVLLCSGRAPRDSHPCWDSGILMVLCHSLPSNVSRIKFKNWFIYKIPYTHTKVGGVSDLAGDIFLFSWVPPTIHPKW